MDRLSWEKLLNQARFGDNRKNYDNSEARTAFQRDFDRIVFSSAFRRMHDKTQVFPIPKNDFVHNRLTHSLEVSCVGRSLGNMAGNHILENEKELKDSGITSDMFGNIVAAACLAHDLGNPPFGHSGENAISEYFNRGEGAKFKDKLDKKEWNDLINYEGNASGFRILTNHHPSEIAGGLRLTYSTLASFTKYPCESFIDEKHNKKCIGRNSQKKYGFFNSEREMFKEVAEKVGLYRLTDEKTNEYSWARHPLAFLVEAADNICYRIIDLEDGFKLRYVSLSKIEELLFPLLEKASDSKTALKKYNKISDEGEKVGYLRAKAINVLIGEVVEAFKVNYESIMNCEFDDDVTKHIASVEILEKHIKNANIELYNKQEVVEIEIAGFNVLGGLLKKFIDAIENPDFPLNRKILQNIPEQFKPKTANESNVTYENLLNITDYVARMTDSFALSLYRKMNGINLPDTFV